MAHSGGGGSAGGGCHGGGFFGGADSDTGSGPVRGQHRYYQGANRYVYYYHGRSHIYYSDSILREEDYRREGVAYLVLGITYLACWLFFMAMVLSDSITTGKLKLDYNSQIYIDDKANLVEDERSLTEALEEFRDATGGCVAVVTKEYSYEEDLVQEALKEYNRLFNDESHWLVYYVGKDKARKDEWAWELICGDDCIKVLDYNRENRFTKRFHKNLLNADYNFDEALMDGLKYIEPKTGKHIYGIKTSEVILLLIVTLLGVWLLILGIMKTWGPISPRHAAKMKAKATAKPQGKLEYVSCPSCGGLKVRGTASKCPYCGSSYRKITSE